jgi:ComF family protein
VCESYISEDAKYNYICNKCLDALPYAPVSEYLSNRLLENLTSKDIAISNAFALFLLEDETNYARLIYNLKYFGIAQIGEELGLLLARKIEIESVNRYDFVVPVPIHNARKRERGYNQSDLIAQSVALHIESVYAPDLLSRVINTSTQTKLKAAERSKNISEALYFDGKYDIAGKKILIVDDVLTTGSTLNECALLLLNNQARLVDVAALARRQK